MLALALLASAAAQANPVGVKRRMAQGDKVVVSCAPGFCSEAVELRLIDAATRLQQATGGRVIVIRTPPQQSAEVYAALSDDLGLGPKDLLLAQDDKRWAARAPGLSPAMLPELVELAGQATSLEAGLSAVARQFPTALRDRPAPPAAPRPAAAPDAGGGTGEPSAAAAAAPDRSAAATDVEPAPADPATADGDLWLYGQIAALVAVAAVALRWLLRRRA